MGIKSRYRELKFPRLPIDCFADDTRKPITNYDDTDPEEPGDPDEPQDPDEYIQGLIKLLKDGPENYNPDGFSGEPGKIGGYWYGQHEYVQVWEEKGALESAFLKFLEGLYVDLIVNRGNSSLTFVYENCKNLRPIVKKFGADHVHVLYSGDSDPSGENMDNVIKRYLKRFGIPEKVFERVILTRKQITDYNIPTRPIKVKKGKGQFKKGEDPNAKRFVAKHGNNLAADLDAFLATDDQAFEKIIRESVKKYWRQDIYDQMVEDYDGVVYRPTSSYAEDEENIRKKMYDKITEAFKPGWEDAEEDDEET